MFGSEKRWAFAAAASEEAFVSAAVAHFGYLGYAFAYAYERKTGVLHQFKQLTPLGLGAEVALEPQGGRSAFWSPLHQIAIDHAGDSLAIRAPGWSAQVRYGPAPPFDAAWDIPGAGAHRTRKIMGQEATGELVVAGRAIPISGGHGLKDWSRGHLARETAWRWAAGAGTCRGRVIGWNLRTGFDDPTQAENAVWIDGAIVRPGPCVIEPGGTWRVAAGPLELVFTPDGAHREDLDLLAIASRYTQPWGAFAGTWEGVAVQGYGVVEDHWARW